MKLELKSITIEKDRKKGKTFRVEFAGSEDFFGIQEEIHVIRIPFDGTKTIGQIAEAAISRRKQMEELKSGA